MWTAPLLVFEFRTIFIWKVDVRFTTSKVKLNLWTNTPKCQNISWTSSTGHILRMAIYFSEIQLFNSYRNKVIVLIELSRLQKFLKCIVVLKNINNFSWLISMKFNRANKVTNNKKQVITVKMSIRRILLIDGSHTLDVMRLSNTCVCVYFWRVLFNVSMWFHILKILLPIPLIIFYPLMMSLEIKIHRSKKKR